MLFFFQQHCHVITVLIKWFSGNSICLSSISYVQSASVSTVKHTVVLNDLHFSYLIPVLKQDKV